MTEHQSGLRFDVYERVHLDESLAGIQALEEIEMIPHIQVLQEEDQAILKGNLWLTGTYLGEAGEERQTLEHFIPVEITLPMNRIHRLEDIAIEIENFDIDLLSARSLNVTGVLSLHGIEMTSKVEEGWKEEEEFTVVHRAEEGGARRPGQKAEADVEEAPQEASQLQSAWEEASQEASQSQSAWEEASQEASQLQSAWEEAAQEASQLQSAWEEAAQEASQSQSASDEAKGPKISLGEKEEKLKSRPVIRPEANIQREQKAREEAERSEKKAADPPASEQVESGEDHGSSRKLSLNFRSAGSESDRLHEGGNRASASPEGVGDRKASRENGSWMDSIFTAQSEDKGTVARMDDSWSADVADAASERIDPALPQLASMKGKAKPDEPSAFSEDRLSQRKESVPDLPNSAIKSAGGELKQLRERERSPEDDEQISAAGMPVAEPDSAEEEQQAEKFALNEQEEPAKMEMTETAKEVEEATESKPDEGTVEIASAEIDSSEPAEEAEDAIAVSMPEKQELKIAFGKKTSSESIPPYHLTNLMQKTDITELEAGQPVDSAEREMEEQPAVKEGVEWKRLFIREEGMEHQFKRMRMCIVQKDDSIDTIAERYNINSREIILCNRLGDQPVEEGQVLYIP